MRPEKSLVGFAPHELPLRNGTGEVISWKRVGHGGVAWTATAKADTLHQPQDGAQEIGTLHTAITRVAFREPEDARLTGGTRSLMRRVMGLNVMALTGTRKAQPRSVIVKSQAQVA